MHPVFAYLFRQVLMLQNYSRRSEATRCIPKSDCVAKPGLASAWSKHLLLLEVKGQIGELPTIPLALTQR